MNTQKFALLPPHKKVLNFQEACEYLGYSRAYLYKLTSKGIVPHSKPTGKALYFDRDKLDQFLLSNSTMSWQERETKVATYIATNPIQ